MRSLAVLLILSIPFSGAAVAQEAAPLASATPPRRTVSPDMVDRWHRGRVLYGIGSVAGLLGSGLTISSVLIVAITGYPCDPNDPIHQLNPNDSCNRNSASYRAPKPTDPAPLLAYIGSSTSALGFIFSASGLGYQHSLLRELDIDPGRGLFAAGTTLGLVGFLGVGAGYFFGLTNFLDAHDQGIAILASSISGTVLCAVGSLLYTIDESRLKRAWQRFSTF
jgi:hypothetical protein